MIDTIFWAYLIIGFTFAAYWHAADTLSDPPRPRTPKEFTSELIVVVISLWAWPYFLASRTYYWIKKNTKDTP